MALPSRHYQARSVYTVDAVDPMDGFSNGYDIMFDYAKDAGNLKIYLRTVGGKQVALSLGRDYIVRNFDGSPIYGRVVMLRAFSGLRSVVVSRNVTEQQQVRFTQQLLSSGSLESAFDRATIYAQDQNFRNYTLSAPDDDANGVSLVLPKAADRAGKYLKYGKCGEIEPTTISPHEFTQAMRSSEDEPDDPTFVLPRDKRRHCALGFEEDTGHVCYLPDRRITMYRAGNGINITPPQDNQIFVSGIYSGGRGISVNDGDISTTFKEAEDGTVRSDVYDNTVTLRGGYIAGNSVTIVGNEISFESPNFDEFTSHFTDTLLASDWERFTPENERDIYVQFVYNDSIYSGASVYMDVVVADYDVVEAQKLETEWMKINSASVVMHLGSMAILFQSVDEAPTIDLPIQFKF